MKHYRLLLYWLDNDRHWQDGKLSQDVIQSLIDDNYKKWSKKYH